MHRELFKNILCGKQLKRYFWGILTFKLYFIFANLMFGTICLTMIFFGLPCPACGLTRAGVLFLTGNFAESFAMHPLLLPTIVFIAVTLAIKYFWPDKIKFLEIPAVIMLAIFVALYIFRMVNLFPNHPPMVVNSDSILYNIISLLRGDGMQ